MAMRPPRRSTSRRQTDRLDAGADEHAAPTRAGEGLERARAVLSRGAVVEELDHDLVGGRVTGHAEARGAGGQRAAQQMHEETLGLARLERGARQRLALDVHGHATQEALELGGSTVEGRVELGRGRRALGIGGRPRNVEQVVDVALGTVTAGVERAQRVLLTAAHRAVLQLQHGGGRRA